MRKTWYPAALLCSLLIAAPTPSLLAQVPQTSPAPAATQSVGNAGNINLDLDAVPAEDAFDALAKQAGVDLTTQDSQLWASSSLITIKVQNGRFWPTFVELCKQAGNSLIPAWEGARPRSIRLYSTGGSGTMDFASAPKVESQGFLLMPQSATRTATISYVNAGPFTPSLTMQLGIFVDPSQDMVQVGPISLTEAADENGLPLLPTNRGSTGMTISQPSLIQNTPISLNCPPNAGKKIARIKGALHARVATKTQLVEIESPLTAKALTRQIPDYDLTIEPLKQLANGNNPNTNLLYQIKVSFKARDREGGGLRQESNRDFWPLISTITVTDANGLRFSTYGWNGGGAANGIIEYTTNFIAAPGSGLGEPARLTWKVPVETEEIRIPFELKDLPIP
jgi:hypothetical protein